MDDISPAVFSEVHQSSSNASSTENPPTIAASTLLNQSILPNTFLSPPVLSLLSQSTSSTEYGNHIIIDDNLHLNWAAIEQILSTKITSDLYSDYRTFAVELGSIAKHIYSKHINKSTLSQLSELYSWTHSPQLYSKCLELLLIHQSQLDVHLCLLLCSAAMERSLGDVYLHISKAQQCPRLLKDLLCTKELENVFGKFPMFCLQCLIGSPSGFNLRNIAWHGFVSPGEAPKELIAFLLVVFANFSQVLAPMMPISHRPFSSFPQENIFKNVFPDFNIEYSFEIFKTSTFVIPSMVSIWQSALRYFQHQQYGYFVSLILPCLEHSLRRVFAHCNSCPQRVLTAESTVLYTTFDEILSQTITSADDGTQLNRLPNEIGIPYMELLMDLLVLPEGPRIRDKISHGEVDLDSVSRTMAEFIMGIAVAFCGLFATEKEHCALAFVRVASCHRSLFHPLSLLKRELSEVLLEMSKWSVIDSYHGDKEDACVDLVVDTNFFEGYSATVEQSIQQLLTARRDDSDTHQTAYLLHQLSNPQAFNDFNITPIEVVMSAIWEGSIQTLYMGRNEVEIIGVLRKAAGHLATAFKQIRITARDRYKSYLNKNLRSRQRANFDKLLSNVGLYWSCAVLTCVLIYLGVPLCPVPQALFCKRIRFYKKVLQFTENFLSQAMPSKNCWEEVQKHCRVLIQNCDKLNLK